MGQLAATTGHQAVPHLLKHRKGGVSDGVQLHLIPSGAAWESGKLFHGRRGAAFLQEDVWRLRFCATTQNMRQLSRSCETMLHGRATGGGGERTIADGLAEGRTAADGVQAKCTAVVTGKAAARAAIRLKGANVAGLTLVAVGVREGPR